MYVGWDDFRNVILRDVPSITEQDFVKLLEDVPLVKVEVTAADREQDRKGINANTAAGKEEYDRRLEKR